MTEMLLIGLVVVCCFISLVRWQSGIWAVLLVGFLQDPLRKMAPNQPPYMITMAAVVFIVIIFSLFIKKYSFRPATIPGWRNGVAQGLSAFFILLVFQLLNGYINSGSVVIVGLGVLGYVAPLFAIFVGYYFGSHYAGQNIYRFFRIYCIGCLVFVAGIYLEYFGFDSSALGEVGSGLKIYDLGTILKAHSGLFRSSEIAAWHVFMGASFMFIMFFKVESKLLKYMLVISILFLITAGALTGRRKLFVSIFIFGFAYWAFTFVYLKQSFKVASLFIGIAAVGFLLMSQSVFLNNEDSQEYDLYLERSGNVFGDIDRRFEVLGVAAVTTAIKEYGIFGLGAGTFSQGARFDASSAVSRFAWQTEGGFGRVVVELGLIGLLVLFYLFYLMVRYLHGVLTYLSVMDPDRSRLCFGIVSVLISNIAHFSVAAQVFGDSFVLIILGLLSGFIISFPTQIHLNRQYSAITGRRIAI